jgi:hypothetical protein
VITGEWLRNGPSLTLLIGRRLYRPAAHIARRNIKIKIALQAALPGPRARRFDMFNQALIKCCERAVALV